MTPIEMAKASVDAMAEPAYVGVVLILPKGKLPRGFPRGTLLNEMERNGVIERTYHFNPLRVLAWLVKRGLVKMERTGDRTLRFYEP